MGLTIITGTHTFIDLGRKFRQAFINATQRRNNYNILGCHFTKSRFERVTIDKIGNVIRQPSRIFPLDGNGFSWSVSQPTGSGKTILAAYHLKRTFFNGGNIQANFSFKYFKQNYGKPKEEWTPNINSIEDLVAAKKCRVALDDIKGTIDHWQAKEADIVSNMANVSRKGGVDIDITTQRVINYIPPNIRAIATGYEIPYITIRDQRQETPDNKGYPVEMEVLSLIPSDGEDIFVGFGCLNGDIPDNTIITPTPELLNSYSTMAISQGLKGTGIRTNQPGYALEVACLKQLKASYPREAWKHLNGKEVYDILSDKFLIDVVGRDANGDLITEHKNLMKHLSVSNKTGKQGYLMFEHLGSIGFIKITSRVASAHRGDRIDLTGIHIKKELQYNHK